MGFEDKVALSQGALGFYRDYRNPGRWRKGWTGTLARGLGLFRFFARRHFLIPYTRANSCYLTAAFKEGVRLFRNGLTGHFCSGRISL